MEYKKILTGLFFIVSSFFLQGCTKHEENTFVFWTVQLKMPAGDLIQKTIDEFQSIHPEMKIVWVDIPVAETQKRAIASILGGNPPDLINLNPEYSISLAQKNTLEYFSEDEAKDYNKGLVDKLRIDGKIYAIPFYATSAVTILNKEKFKNCNVEIKTYNDILNLEQCKESPSFGLPIGEGEVFSKILNKYGVNDEKTLNEVYFLFYEMNKKGLLPKDVLTVNHREIIEKYMSQNVAFINAGSNFINMIKENAPDIYSNSVILPQLTGLDGKYDVSIMNFVIPKKSKNKELAKEFLKLLTNEENQLEFSKKTNVLPANQKALDNDYFKNCSSDIYDTARCIASYQLNSPVTVDFGQKNKKEITEVVNNSLEILFLKGEDDFIKQETYKKIKMLQE